VLEVSVESADHQRGPGEDIETKGVVIMKPRAGAVADILVRRTTVVRPLEGQPGKEQRRTSEERFVWDGARYRAEGAGAGAGRR
jgi:hypothetical protein